MKSFTFRNSKEFLRNQFDKDGLYEFPIIRCQKINLKNIELISCSDINKDRLSQTYKGIHHFVDDYRFEVLYNHPDKKIETYRKYRFVLTPDYSLYNEMDIWRQIESVGKSRWVGAYWQNNGMRVIPTVSWSTPTSFEFCFDGIEKHCIVAIGMIGCKKNKMSFLKGYYKMLEKIQPQAVICFGKPFREMQENVIEVDYMSSRKVVHYGR